MKRRRLAAAGTILIGLALFAVTWGVLFPRKKVELRWNLQPGQVLRYRTVMSTSSTAGTGDRQGWDEVVTVRSVKADGSILFTHVTESMTVRKPGLDYSSSRGDPLPDAPEIRAHACLVGLPLQVRMNPRGELLDVQGVEEQEQKRLQAVEKMNFMGWLTAVPLRGNPLGGMEFPARPLAIGECWSQDYQTGTETLGRAHQRITYTLLKVDQDIAELGVTMELVEQSPGSLQKMVGDLKLPEPRRREEHRIRFSLNRGLLLSDRDFTRIDSTTLQGKPFFFEAVTERILVEK